MSRLGVDSLSDLRLILHDISSSPITKIILFMIVLLPNYECRLQDFLTRSSCKTNLSFVELGEEVKIPTVEK